MDLNATLLGQMITFLLFIAFTMKFVWPFITKSLDERRDKIADGLAAAERGRVELEAAQRKSEEEIATARQNAAEILEQAHRRADQIVDESKHTARIEGEKLLEQARKDIEQEMQSAKEKLRGQVASLVLAGTERLLERNLDAAANDEIISKLITEL